MKIITQVQDLLSNFFSLILVLCLTITFILLLTISTTVINYNTNSSADIYLSTTNIPLNKLNFSLIDPLTSQLELSGFHNVTIIFDSTVEGFILYNHSLLNNYYKISEDNVSELVSKNQFEIYHVLICNSYFFKLLHIPLINGSFYIVNSDLPSNASISLLNWKGKLLINNISLIDISSIQLMPLIRFSNGGGIPTNGILIPVSSIPRINNASIFTPFTNRTIPSTLGILLNFPKTPKNLVELSNVIKDTIYYSYQIQNILNSIFKVNIGLGALPIATYRIGNYYQLINLYGIEVFIFIVPLLILSVYLNGLNFTHQREKLLPAIEISFYRGGNFIQVIQNKMIKVWLCTITIAIIVIYSLVYFLYELLNLYNLEFYENSSILAMLLFSIVLFLQKIFSLNKIKKHFLSFSIYSNIKTLKSPRTFNIGAIIGILFFGAIFLVNFDVNSDIKSLLITLILVIILILLLYLSLKYFDYILMKKDKKSNQDIDVQNILKPKTQTKQIFFYIENIKETFKNTINTISSTLIRQHITNYIKLHKTLFKTFIIISLIILPTIFLVQADITSNINVTNSLTVLGDVSITGDVSDLYPVYTNYLEKNPYVQSLLAINYTLTTISNPLNNKAPMGSIDTIILSNSILPFLSKEYPYEGSIKELIQFNTTTNDSLVKNSHPIVPVIISSELAKQFSLVNFTLFNSPNLMNASCLIINIIPTFPGLSNFKDWILTLSSNVHYYIGGNIGPFIIALKLSRQIPIPAFIDKYIYLPPADISYKNQATINFTPLFTLLDINIIVFTIIFILVIVQFFWGYFKDLHSFIQRLQIYGFNVHSFFKDFFSNFLNVTFVIVKVYILMGICSGFISVSINIIISSMLGTPIDYLNLAFLFMELYIAIFVIILAILIINMFILYLVSSLKVVPDDSYASA